MHLKEKLLEMGSKNFLAKFCNSRKAWMMFQTHFYSLTFVWVIHQTEKKISQLFKKCSFIVQQETTVSNCHDEIECVAFVSINLFKKFSLHITGSKRSELYLLVQSIITMIIHIIIYSLLSIIRAISPQYYMNHQWSRMYVYFSLNFIGKFLLSYFLAKHMDLKVIYILISSTINTALLLFIITKFEKGRRCLISFFLLVSNNLLIHWWIIWHYFQ